MDGDGTLMGGIRAKFGADIAAAVKGTAVPEAFLAAIVGNESGGKAGATRQEQDTYIRLINVVAGRAAVFSPHGARKPLTLPDLLAYAAPGELEAKDLVLERQGPPFMPLPPSGAPRGLQWGLKRLLELATSWGLTQIMGWHLVEMAGVPGWIWTIGDLMVPASNLKAAVALLGYFAGRYNLDVSASFDPLLHCWNTGAPDLPTFDPNYVVNGLSRMKAFTP